MTDDEPFQRRSTPAPSAERLRSAYGPVRAHFRAHPERYATVQRWLNQARFGTTYDSYLARAVREAGVAAVVGVGLGVAAVVALFGTGAASLSGIGWLVLALPPLLAAVGGASVLGGRVLHPRLVARHRARSIDVMLPHAIVFLYAQVHGGVAFADVLEGLADAEEAYGPVATEFAIVVADVERFDADLYTALGHAHDLTPSDDLAAFLDELVSVLETGGDVTAFLEREADAALERTREEQEALLADLSLLAEAYVAVVFAAPTLLLVVLLVVQFVSGGVLLVLDVLVYVLVPLELAAFVLALRWLDRPFREYAGDHGHDGEPVGDGERVAEYHRERRRARLRQRLREPLALLQDRPLASLAVTAPLSVLAVLTLWAGGVVSPTLAALQRAPTRTTMAVAVLPAVLCGAPYALLHRRRRKRRERVRERFPDALGVLASATRNGVPIGEAFALVADRLSGDLATELERVHHEAGWTDDLTRPLERFAERLRVPAISRVVELLVESIRTTDDLGPVLSVVSEDMATRNALRRTRQRELGQYVVIVVVGVLVYLGIVAMFDTFLLPQFELATAGAETRTFDVGGTPQSAYRRVFFHSALVQAAGNGLLLGRLTGDSVADGVGYAVGMVAVVAAVFGTLTFI